MEWEISRFLFNCRAVLFKRLSFTESHFSDVPLAQDVFHHYLYHRPLEASLAAGWCRVQPLNVAAFFYLFRIATCWMVCPVSMFSDRGLETCGLTWRGWDGPSFHLCRFHQTSASPQLFEGSLIPAFRIKPMKKGWEVIEWQKDTS